MAVTSLREFAEDFIRALGAGVAGAWRERWWTVDLLLVHEIEALSDTERAQDEFFHLSEALKRRGARVMLAADRAPSGILRIDDRLRSRFEGGLVLELDAGAASDELALVTAPVGADTGLWGEPTATPTKTTVVGGLPKTAGPAPGAKPATAAVGVASQEARKGGRWFPSAENVILQWPRIEDLLQEDLD
jgi:hypothetical protein